jgi:tetratricopeptide (TPR) repeat protein
MSAFWPAVYLGAARSLPAVLRGVLLACAGVLVDLAVLGESRTWLLVLPLTTALAVLLARQRLRLLLALSLVGAAAVSIAGPLLAVYEAYFNGTSFAVRVDRAAWLIGASAVVLALTGALWAVVDRRVVLGPGLHRATGLAVTVLCLTAAAGGVAKAAGNVGDVQSWVDKRWHEFSNPSAERGTSERRLGGSFAGYRYAEMKVAWGEFLAHPVVGIGSDNYAAAYLLRRDNGRHEPRYPHSDVLRLMSQLGVIGTTLFVVFAVIAVLEGLRRRRRASPLEAAAVSSLLMVFFYWWIHGAFDWFWELPALAAPAFGALGLAGAVWPGRGLPASRTGSTRRRLRSLAVWAALGVAGALACLALALPWLSATYQDAGVGLWRSRPELAYDRLETAGRLNPLDAEPFLLEGSIALRRGETRAARRSLERAVGREPKNWYAHLQLALLAGSLGRYGEADGHLERAAALNPKDPVLETVRGLIRRRASIDPNRINDVYLDQATRLLTH